MVLVSYLSLINYHTAHETGEGTVDPTRIPRERFAAWLGGRPKVYGEGRDFPALPGWPEGRTLKFALTRSPLSAPP